MAFQRRPDPAHPTIAPVGPIVDPWDVPSPVQVAEEAPPTGPADPTALLPWIDDALGFGAGTAGRDETHGTTHVAAPTRVAEAPQPPNRIPYQNWSSIVRSNAFPEQWAPRAVEIPAGVMEGLDAANANAQRTGLEYGGNVVRKGSSYRTRSGGAGGKGSFEPDPGDLGRGESFVGTYHAHTRDEETNGYASFSDYDMSNMIDDNRRVSLLREGKNTHMLARTKEFEALIAQHANDQDPEAFGDQMRGTYNTVYTKVLGQNVANHEAAVEAAVQATARQYHLMYYSGQGANLQRVVGGAK